MEQKDSLKKNIPLSDRLFWKCYRVERKIKVVGKRYRTVLNGSVPFSRFFLAIFIAIVMGIWLIQLKDLSFRQAELKPVYPIIKTVREVVAKEGEKDGEFLVTLPRSPLRGPRKFIRGVVTFYCSDPRYTDSTPFITANGTYVRFGIAASNIVDFDTRVSIPEVFGDTFFVVKDRMNPRYNNRPFFDIWVESCEEAKQRGVHYTVVGIY